MQQGMTIAYVCTSRAVDPHSFFGDPDPYFFLNADPDPEPALQNM